MDAIGDHDVFKMVALRGSSAGAGIDPTDDGIELASPRGTAPILGDEDLRAFPWAAMGSTGHTRRTLDGATLVVGQETVRLRDYGRRDDFTKAYTRLATSWARLVAERRSGGADAALLAKHVELIRVAHLIYRCARSSVDDGWLARLSRLPVVLRTSSKPGRGTPARPTTSARKEREERRKEILDAKQKFVKARNAITDLETIQAQVYATLVES